MTSYPPFDGDDSDNYGSEIDLTGEDAILQIIDSPIIETRYPTVLNSNLLHNQSVIQAHESPKTTESTANPEILPYSKNPIFGKSSTTEVGGGKGKYVCKFIELVKSENYW